MEEALTGRYHLVTFGCQMNKYDSERIEGILSSGGMTPTGDPAEADLILLNTCSIREKAEHKVYSMLGRLARFKKTNKDLLIGLGGCVATHRKEKVFRMAPSVDLLFGPDAMERLPGMIRECRATATRQMEVGFSDTVVWDKPETNVRPSAVSAWVGIMKGCDNHCTYCVVPSTRGPEVSRPPESILEEVEDLARRGYREINLLGQNVNSYGKGLSPAVDFPVLLKRVAEVEGVRRVRFVTSHPKDLSDALIDAMTSSDVICPSLHLPLQAGSDRVLAMMNRGYTSAEYIDRVQRLRKALPGITLSTDVMVGFPTETEEEFEQTLAVMEAVRFDSMYLFNYSRRTGTPSADRYGEVDWEVPKSRFPRALALNKKIIAENNGAMVGSTVEVLCEGPYNEKSEVGDGPVWFGRTPGNHLVMFASDASETGMTVDVTVTSFLGYNLRGVKARAKE